MTIHRTWNWPTREEWAKRRTTAYADENPQPATRQLSAYATPDEVAASIAAIKAALLAANRAERAREDALGPLGRQRGESRRAYGKRLFSEMSEEEREVVISASGGPPYPDELRDILKQLRDDVLPWRWVGMSPPPPLDEIMARYRVAAEQADAAWRERVAATPVDDAAWEKELEWRRQQEDDAAHPERFIIHV